MEKLTDPRRRRGLFRARPRRADSRDQLTRLCYGALASYAFWLYSLGPVLSLLHDQLSLSYAVTSLHSTLWAGGTVLTGLVFRRTTAALGRRRVFWLAAAGAGATAAWFAAADAVALTLAAAGCLGTFGTVLQATTSASLADHHGSDRDRALLEANIGASAAAVLAPLAISGLDRAGVGGRTALLLPILACAGLYAVYRGVVFPASLAPGAAADLRGPMPPGYWATCALVGFAVAIEFCVVFYAAPLVHAVAHIGTVGSVALLGSFYAGELVGRAAGSRLAGVHRPHTLLAVWLAIAGASTLALLLSSSVPVAFVVLCVCGIAIGNLYPLSLGLTIGAARGMTDRAAGHTQLLAGLAVGAAPLALGAIADAIGVQQAFLLEPLLIAAAIPLVLVGRTRAAQTA
jgi:predicted MFS family arabinose efflux permease